ncbi:hypothetical protein PVK06_004275 [Gossypium arboreum]|uniref:Uncharacterized protein n=5 Tax=Gossypium TaxID=3633 RepID=A0ABR0QS00_GOSAR|nr:hypothetical protein PVK06_004275 [Gossypium arboreum]
MTTQIPTTFSHHRVVPSSKHLPSFFSCSFPYKYLLFRRFINIVIISLFIEKIMKRQGSNIEAMAQAAGKHQVRNKSRRGLDADEGEVALCSMQSTLVWWEEWAYVDEQMSWASIWSPFWDVDFVDMAYGALFNDVAWDDDIWDLKNVTVIPKQ